jgi:excisionase family DNA binding protein
MDYLTTKEAGKRLGVSRPRIHVLIHSGRLPARRFGREWLIKPDDLVNYQRRPKGNFKLTPEQITRIKARAAEGAMPEELAGEFSVSTRTIYRHLQK